MKKLIYFLVAGFLLICSQVKAQEMVVIANKSISESAIDLGNLTSIFLLNKVTWSNGSQIKIFDMKEGFNKAKVYEAMHKQELEVRKQWLRKKLSEGVEEPKVLSSEDDILHAVKNTPGAIGYVAKVKATDEVKILLSVK